MQRWSKTLWNLVCISIASGRVPASSDLGSARIRRREGSSLHSWLSPFLLPCFLFLLPFPPFICFFGCAGSSLRRAGSLLSSCDIGAPGRESTHLFLTEKLMYADDETKPKPYRKVCNESKSPSSLPLQGARPAFTQRSRVIWFLCMFSEIVSIHVRSLRDMCMYTYPMYVCTHMDVHVCSASCISYRSRSISTSCTFSSVYPRDCCASAQITQHFFLSDCVFVVGMWVSSCMYPATLPADISPRLCYSKHSLMDVAARTPMQYASAHTSQALVRKYP